MSIEAPNLDDRDFHDLMTEARRRIRQECPEWTDLSPGEPGTVLLEVFAHLTEVMIYRINRLPEKIYIELLRLLGVRLAPPSSASTVLRFSRSNDSDRPIEIPEGTRVAAERPGDDGEPVVFVTCRLAKLDAGREATVEVPALHGELVKGELIGFGDGTPGQRLVVERPPITAQAGSEADLVIAVEVLPEELDDRARAIPLDERIFQVWTEVENFANPGEDRRVYRADRATGTVQFAPSARWREDDSTVSEVARTLAELPPPGREVRAWYRRGGGDVGNVAAHALGTLKDPIPGVEVTNPRPATGGRDLESSENALVRGPQELHGLDRVVKSKDFERAAIRSSGAVARARALTLSRLWKHAVAGTVQVVLVPDLPAAIKEEGRIDVATMAAHETDDALERIAEILDARRPLGTACRVQWGRYKTVGAAARIVVYREENPIALRERVLDRLYRTIQPLANEHVPTGWGFGETLRASHIYDIVLSEPGVKYADSIRLRVDHVPRQTRVLQADPFQPCTWYASSAASVLRSSNDGTGWEKVIEVDESEVRGMCSHPELPGALALLTRPQKGEAWIHRTTDCGETWSEPVPIRFEVEDMAWLPGRREPTLLLAADVGLFQVALGDGEPELSEIPVHNRMGRAGFYAVETLVDPHGNVLVAVAAQRTGGVYLSRQGGQPHTFQLIGLEREDIRRLAIRKEGPDAWLWAAVAAAGNRRGKGCFRWLLSEFSAEGWKGFDAGWSAGSCHDLAFQGNLVLAASHRAGVMRLDSALAEPSWQPSAVASSGLPPRDRGRLFPVYAVEVDPEGQWVFAAGPKGVFRSRDGGEHFEPLSETELDRVTIPETWLFCSGQHEIEVVTEDEADRD